MQPVSSFPAPSSHRKPIPIIDVAIQRSLHLNRPRVAILLLLDTRGREELKEIFRRTQLESPPEVIWMTDPDYGGRLSLALIFTEPTAGLVLTCDRRELTGPFELMLDGAELRLRPGNRGERLESAAVREGTFLSLALGGYQLAPVLAHQWSQDIADLTGTPLHAVEIERHGLRYSAVQRVAFPDISLSPKILGVRTDSTPVVIELGADALLRHLGSPGEAQAIAAWERLHNDLHEMSNEFTRLWAGLVPHISLPAGSPPTAETVSAELLGDALGALGASMTLLLRGHGLPSGVLMRSAVEAVIAAAILSRNPEMLSPFLSGKLRPERKLGLVKDIPPLRRMYGLLSGLFAHVDGRARWKSRLLRPFEEGARSEELLLGLEFGVLFAIGVVSEYIFLEDFKNPSYWTQQSESEVTFNSTAADRLERRLTEAGLELPEQGTRANVRRSR